MRPGPVVVLVVYQLEQVAWDPDPVVPDSGALLREHWPSNHEDITLGPAHVVPRVLFDLCPGTAVVLDVLRHHIGQAETLRHGRRRGHVARRRHMPPGVAHAIRARVLQWVGIPCGIGIAPTKTLAKLANHVTKTAERKPGSYPAELAQVCNLAQLPREELDLVLEATEVGEIWGVGRKITTQLNEPGIETVLDLARLDPATVRRRWSVVLERTVRELQGMPCIGLDDQPPPKKEIACTRSFGQPVSDLAPVSCSS